MVERLIVSYQWLLSGLCCYLCIVPMWVRYSAFYSHFLQRWQPTLLFLLSIGWTLKLAPTTHPQFPRPTFSQYVWLSLNPLDLSLCLNCSARDRLPKNLWIINFEENEYQQVIKGRRHNLKTEKFWTMSEIGLTFLNFRLIWKMLTPPLGSISDIFEFENILMTEDPPD